MAVIHFVLFLNLPPLDSSAVMNLQPFDTSNAMEQHIL